MKVIKKNQRIKNNKIKLDTVSGVACNILLVIYATQIKNIEHIEELKIGFKSNLFSGKTLTDDYYNKFELVEKLLAITNNISILISAFQYLKDKDFLRFDKSGLSNESYSFSNFHLTAKGIDIIEDAKNNPLKSREFAKTFNLGLAINIDGVIKANNIVGVGGAASVNLK